MRRRCLRLTAPPAHEEKPAGLAVALSLSSWRAADRTFPINGEQKPGAVGIALLHLVSALASPFNREVASGVRAADASFRPGAGAERVTSPTRSPRFARTRGRRQTSPAASVPAQNPADLGDTAWLVAKPLASTRATKMKGATGAFVSGGRARPWRVRCYGRIEMTLWIRRCLK